MLLCPCLGTQTIWSSLMMIPNSVLNAATGIPESTFTEFKKMPLVIAPGTGGEACLARCNITFQAVRSDRPLRRPPCATRCRLKASRCAGFAWGCLHVAAFFCHMACLLSTAEVDGHQVSWKYMLVWWAEGRSRSQRLLQAR